MTSGTNTHENMSPGNPINEDMDHDVTISSNQSHDGRHNNDGTNEMRVNTNMTTGTSEGNGGHCMSNEDCLGDENMDNHSDHQDPSQGKLRSKISKKWTWTDTFLKTDDTSDGVRDKGTLIIVERDGEKEGSRDKHSDFQDQGTLRAKTT